MYLRAIKLASILILAAAILPAQEHSHYSALTQINRENVSKLQVAWQYDTGDAFPDSEMQCQPIIVDGVLYATSPKLRLIALDAASGKLRWSFDPNQQDRSFGKSRNRGVTYWTDGRDARIFYAAGPFLYAVDAHTGKLASSFGAGGRIDLRENLGREPRLQSISMTSPGVVYKDLLITGSIVSESLPASPGDIRAFDVHTGKLRWSFHTIPHPGEFGYDTWPRDAWTYIGGANNWSGMTLDDKRGLVFVPTGSAAFDFYGSNRTGDNLFANCLIALKAETGERVWHFQTVRHDLWDRDLPVAPALVTVQRNGRTVDALAQITKSGFVFLFDRDTGEPLFPIEYRKSPPGAAEGEHVSDSQPLPVKPPPFARQVLTEDMLTRRTPEAHEAVLKRFKTLRSAGQFVPPSTAGTVVFPGFDGGGEWGGPAFDAESGLLYVNANEMAWVLRLVPSPSSKSVTDARSLYAKECAGCHRADMRGTPPEFPALTNLSAKRSHQEIESIVNNGAGRMPGFRRLGAPSVSVLTRFLLTGENGAISEQPSPIEQKYAIDGYNKFLDPDGYPAVEPPWGTLNAIDLNRGEIVWKIPFGEYPELVARGLKNTGSENYGGPVLTAGGLLFIGATIRDDKFRAFDKTTGKLLWETRLPAGGSATPLVYAADGREFVVIAAGGGKFGAQSGGAYVAFALPKN